MRFIYNCNLLSIFLCRSGTPISLGLLVRNRTATPHQWEWFDRTPYSWTLWAENEPSTISQNHFCATLLDGVRVSNCRGFYSYTDYTAYLYEHYCNVDALCEYTDYFRFFFFFQYYVFFPVREDYQYNWYYKT